MNPLSGTTQRLQSAIYNLRVVQGNFQGVQDTYTSLSDAASTSFTDLKNCKKPMANALGDARDKSVAADGKTLVALVGGTVTRLRKTQGTLALSAERSPQAAFPLPALQQELTSLAQSAESPEAAALISQSVDLLGQGAQFHAWAARTAGWSRQNSLLGEGELSQVGNQLSIVSKDNDQGKNVSGDMAIAKPRIDTATEHVGRHAANMGDTVKQEANGIAVLADAQNRLAQALALLSPPPHQPPSLLDVLHANDPNRPH